VQEATHPIVSHRTETILDFLANLDVAEKELTVPDHDFVPDPSRAQIGEMIEGGFTVIHRLGEGESSVGFLVEREEQDFILKVASEPEHKPRLRDEGAILDKLRHAHVVECLETLELGNRVALLMRPVFADKQKKIIETLGQRLRKEGRLQVELLQRFGEDLLDVLNHLEEQGIPHRDIKPDNIAVGKIGKSDSNLNSTVRSCALPSGQTQGEASFIANEEQGSFSGRATGNL
jgi:serine/threonine protein kinase